MKVRHDPELEERGRMNAEVRKAHEFQEFITPEGCFILELANDEGDPRLSISRARVPVGVTTEWHELADTDERYVIVSGEGFVEVGSFAPIEVRSSDIVWIPANTQQRIRNSGREDLIFMCICTPRFRPESYVPIAKAEIGG